MYEFIKGTIAELSPAHVVIEASSGVGYYLNISLQTYTQLSSLTQAKVYTYLAIRDDAQIFYGFFDKSERELFKLLIGVSGVGGGTARMILSSFASDELRVIIATGKAEVLKSVKGLGIKTAQKVIVELRDKVGNIAISEDFSIGGAVKSSPVFEEALSAMMMLGFARAVSEKVVEKIIKDNPQMKVEQVIRIALKSM